MWHTQPEESAQSGPREKSCLINLQAQEAPQVWAWDQNKDSYTLSSRMVLDHKPAIPADAEQRNPVSVAQESVGSPYLGSEHPHLSHPCNPGPHCRDETWGHIARSPDNCARSVGISGLYSVDLGANRSDSMTRLTGVALY